MYRYVISYPMRVVTEFPVTKAENLFSIAELCGGRVHGREDKNCC